MRRTVIFCVLLINFINLTCVCAEKPGVKLSIKIIPDKPKYMIGEELNIVLSVKNTSDKTLYFNSLLAHKSIQYGYNLTPQAITIPKGVCGSMSRKSFVGGTYGYKRKDYKEIPQESFFGIQNTCLALNTAGKLEIYYSFSNHKNKYYKMSKSGHYDMKKEFKMENAWIGRVFSRETIEVEDKPCPEFEEKIVELESYLEGENNLQELTIESIISMALGYMAVRLINKFSDYSNPNRINILKVLSKYIDKADGFRIVEEFYKLYKSDKQEKDHTRFIQKLTKRQQGCCQGIILCIRTQARNR